MYKRQSKNLIEPSLEDDMRNFELNSCMLASPDKYKSKSGKKAAVYRGTSQKKKAKQVDE